MSINAYYKLWQMYMLNINVTNDNHPRMYTYPILLKLFNLSLTSSSEHAFLAIHAPFLPSFLIHAFV